MGQDSRVSNTGRALCAGVVQEYFHSAVAEAGVSGLSQHPEAQVVPGKEARRCVHLLP